MAHLNNAPYAAQDPQEVAYLVRNLEAHSTRSEDGKKSFICKKHSFPIPGSDTGKVDSWRFQDWDYKRDDLPTYARGLFTYRSPQGVSEVVVRGYDKFFNTDEVSKTKWTNIEKNTRGPYELSVKENGCIIFISGLPGDVLLVCSKHSTGARVDTDLSHAVAGERWVERHLASKGKTKADLARELRRMNVTAVAELCDDSFEEHVLAYSEDRAGLYVHGLNLNLPDFATYPGHLVQRFAQDWGFRKTDYLVKNDIHAVRTFLEAVGESGAWEGKDVEGFVIRCQYSDDGKDPWADWFFKYKFEEPYLMYRQWRECTRSLLAGKPPRYRKHKVTEEYLLYARQQFAKNPSLSRQFSQNHGIIALRDGFLEHKGLRGSDLIRQEQEAEDINALEHVKRDIILVPIATIGCGKTTVAVALQKLFGWGHVQNDNIQVKVRKPLKFASEVCAGLSIYPVVIADRNNHQKRERKQIIEDVNHISPGTRLVALHYVHEKRDEIRRVLRERVLSRGDNHQTIQALSKGPAEVIGIMEGFLARFEPANRETSPDDGFETIIDLDPVASSRENLETVITQLRHTYPSLIEVPPTGEDMDAAIQATLQDYQPDIKHDLSFSSNKKNPKANNNNSNQRQQTNPPPKSNSKPPKLEFFCIKLPTDQVRSALDRLFSSLTSGTAGFYHQLQKTNRIQAAFHVTLIHRKSSTEQETVWNDLVNRHSQAVTAAATRGLTSPWDPPSLGNCRVQLERAVWDGRVLCIVVRLLDAEQQGFRTVNEVAHMTVGTASAEIKPVESNALLKRWLLEGSGYDTGIGEAVVEGGVVLLGEVKGVMGR